MDRLQDRSKLEIFHKAPIPKAVLTNALPAMAAQLMVLIYNLADTFFIGQVHDALQVAAVSLVMPIFLIFMALGAVFGIGGTSVISRALGEGRHEYAGKTCSFCMWGSAAVGVAVAAVILLLSEPLLSLIGTSGNTRAYARQYLTIVTLCGPFVVIANCFSNVIRAEGQSARAMTGQLVGNFINFVLDPIMILWLNWQIAGAAIATVIGNVFAGVYYIAYFLRGKSSLSIRPRDFTLKESVCSGVLSIGVPAALGFLLMSLSSIFMNVRIAAYDDMAVAGIGVACKVGIITATLSMGLGQGIQPLLGYCVGAKMWDRFRKCFRFSALFAFGLSSLMTVMCFLFVKPIVGVFLSEAAALDYGMRFSRILLSTSFLFGALYVFMNAMQAMGDASSSLVLNISRQGLVYIPLLFVLERLIGLDGLVWAQPAADAVTFVFSVLLYHRALRRRTQSMQSE